MTEFRLFENEYVHPNDLSLFHSPEFFRLQKGGSRGSYFEFAVERDLLATIHFSEGADGHWRSPGRGTYAGFQLVRPLTLESLASFYQLVEERLRASGARQIEILLVPEAHEPILHAETVYLLLANGFTLSRCDLNYTIGITGQPLSERMSYGNRKRLRKCERESLIAKQLPLEDLSKIYDVIAANRAVKGHSVSMSLAQLEEMASLFPDRMLLFGVLAETELAAAALCLRLTSDVVYVFYWGDRPGYSNFSPVVALAAEIYAFCAGQGIRVLDAGTSTEGPVPNHGLIQFKQGLGFSPSLKLRATKSL